MRLLVVVPYEDVRNRRALPVAVAEATVAIASQDAECELHYGAKGYADQCARDQAFRALLSKEMEEL